MTGGLRLARLQLFSRARSGVAKVILLVTDGKPTREKDGMAGELEALSSIGVRVLVVGVSNRARILRLGGTSYN